MRIITVYINDLEDVPEGKKHKGVIALDLPEAIEIYQEKWKVDPVMVYICEKYQNN